MAADELLDLRTVAASCFFIAEAALSSRRALTAGLLADPHERGVDRDTVAVRQPVPVLAAEGIPGGDVVAAPRPCAGGAEAAAARFAHVLVLP